MNQTGKNLIIYKTKDFGDLSSFIPVPADEVPELVTRPSSIGRMADGMSVQPPGDEYAYVALSVDDVELVTKGDEEHFYHIDPADHNKPAETKSSPIIGSNRPLVRIPRPDNKVIEQNELTDRCDIILGAAAADNSDE